MTTPGASLHDLMTGIEGPIVVIGAGGFVGANLTSALLSARTDCTSISTSPTNWRNQAHGLPAHRIATGPAQVREILDEVGPRTIFNLAAHGAYPSQDDFTHMLETNVTLVHTITGWAETNRAVLVHTGSSSEYGVNCSGPTSDTPPLPNSAYAVTKLAGSNWIQHRCREGELDAVVLRLYSVYGPGEDPSRLMPAVVREGLEKRLPPFGNPATSRDFVYVDDVVEALVRAALRARSTARGHCVSIGSGTATSLGEVGETARSVFGIAETPTFGQSMRAWDLSDWYADPREAREVLDWSPTTSLESGLRRMASWWATNGHLATSVTANDSADRGGSADHRISAVIACYRDGEAIPYMYQRLVQTFERIGCRYEIIFVNDCSPDDSQKVIESLAARDTNVVGILHSRNFGSQAAFLSGMEVSTGDFVVLLDGDLQDPPEMIEEMYRRSQDGFDVVYGRRVAREASWFMQRAYRAFYRIFSSVAPFEIPRDAGDFSLMSREVVESIIAMPERDLFIRAQRAYVGFRQTGVDYVRPERMFGTTTNSLSRNMGWATRGVLAVSRAPLTLMSVVALVLFLFSALVVAVQIGMKLLGLDSAPQGWVTLWVVIVGLGSLNLLAIAIVGEYVGRVLEEIKRRPRFVRRTVIGASVAKTELGSRDHRGEE